MADRIPGRCGVSLALLAAAGRDTAPIMLLPVAILSMAGAWRALSPGMAGWDFASDALLDSVRVSGPVAAGLAAWITIGSERSGLGSLERLGRRSAAAGPLTRLGVAACAALAGYALTAVAVAAWLGAHGTVTGSLQAAEVAAGGAALLAHVTIGFLAALLLSGRHRQARLAPVAGHVASAAATAAAMLAATWALDGWRRAGRRGGAGWPSLLLSPDVHHSPFTHWRPGFFVAALTWFCGLAAASVLASGLALTRRHRYAIAFAAVSVVAGVGLSQLRIHAAHPMTAISGSAVCRNWPLEVCVNPAFAAALPQLESAFTAVAAKVSGTTAAIRSVTQLPPGANASPRPGGYGFHLDDLRQGYALRAEADLTRQVAAILNRQLATAGIDHRVRFAQSPAVQPVCRPYVPYAVEGGLELADMCTQRAHHLRPGRVQPP